MKATRKKNYYIFVHTRHVNYQEFVVKFAPQEAKVTIASAVFKLRENKNEISKVLKLSGIGKFPFITSSVEKIDFESLTVGKTD